MTGAEIFYRVPTSEGGWRILKGNVVNITETALVVREKYFGGQSTINPNWLICYVWEIVPDCSKESALEAKEFVARTNQEAASA